METSWASHRVDRVLEEKPEAMNPEALTGYVWLATPEKVPHAEERHLEFTDDPLV